MELQKCDYLSGRSMSSNKVNSTSSISAPPKAFVQPVIPTYDSFISTCSNSEICSVSPIVSQTVPTSPKFHQTETSIKAVRSMEQTIPHQLPSTPPSVQTPSQASMQGIDKNSKLELQCDDSVWECLKKQDEKWSCLQEQIVRLLEQKTLPYNADPKSALVPTINDGNVVSETRNDALVEKSALLQANRKSRNGNLVSDLRNGTLVGKSAVVPANGNVLSDTRNGALVGSSEVSQLLSCMHVQNEQILKQQEQISKLQEQMLKLQDQNHILQTEKQKLLEKNHELTYQLLVRSERQPLHFADRFLSPEFISPLPSFQNSPIEGSVEKLPKQVCNGIEQTPKSGTKKVSSEKSNRTVSSHHNQTTAKKTRKNSNSIGNLKIHENQEVEKTSTSTMTSLIYDGNDKVVYQKLTTVTTDLKKQSSQLMAECSVQKKDATPENTRTTPKTVASSSRRKVYKCRKCGKCSPNIGCGKKKEGSLKAIENGCEKIVEDSPQCMNETIDDVREIDCKKNEIQSTKRIISPRYENILKNVNELSLKNVNNEDEATSRVEPILKPIAREWRRKSPFRAVDDSPISQKTSENRRYSDRSRASACSNSSTDSLDTSLDYRTQKAPCKNYAEDKTAGSTTISVYGLSSPNLSKDTKQYLDNFGLIRNKNGDYYKSRTTLAKKYLR